MTTASAEAITLRAAMRRFAARRAASTNTSALASPAINSAIANAATIAAPVGRSRTYEPARPAALATMPAIKAIVRMTET